VCVGDMNLTFEFDGEPALPSGWIDVWRHLHPNSASCLLHASDEQKQKHSAESAASASASVSASATAPAPSGSTSASEHEGFTFDGKLNSMLHTKYRNRLDRCFALFPASPSAPVLHAAALQVVGDKPFCEVDTPLPSRAPVPTQQSAGAAPRTPVFISDHFGLLGSVAASASATSAAADSKVPSSPSPAVDVNVPRQAPAAAASKGAGGAAPKACLLALIAVLTLLFCFGSTHTARSSTSYSAHDEL
jgi:hypothetical protein